MSTRLRLRPYYDRLIARLEALPGGAPMLQAVRWTWLLYGQLERDQAFQRAAAMAYATLLALVPSLVLVVSILKGVGALDDDLEAAREVVFGTLLGGVPGVADWLWEGLISLDFARLGIAGIIGVVYMSARLYLLVERAYTEIFGATVRRSFYLRLVTYWSAVTTAPVVGYITFSVMRSAAGSSLAASTLALGLQFAMLFAALKLLPSTKVKWGPAFVGALVSSVLMSVGQRGFRLYVLVFRSDDPLAVIYGSVGLVFVVLLWLYLMWIFVLIGVEVAFVLQHFNSLVEVERAEEEAQAKVPRRASLAQVLDAAVHLARAFRDGSGPVDPTEIRRETGLRGRELSAVLEVLRELGWAVEASDERWSIARPLDQLRVEDAVVLWRTRTSPCAESETELRVEEALLGCLPETLEELLGPPTASSAPESA